MSAIRAKCQAICEDYERPAYSAPAQRITVPGAKPCSRYAVEQIGHLHLCRVHARLAWEGLIKESGHVAPRPDIQAVRRYPKKFPRGLYDWVHKLTESPAGAQED